MHNCFVAANGYGSSANFGRPEGKGAFTGSGPVVHMTAVGCTRQRQTLPMAQRQRAPAIGDVLVLSVSSYRPLWPTSMACLEEVASHQRYKAVRIRRDTLMKTTFGRTPYSVCMKDDAADDLDPFDLHPSSPSRNPSVP